jgi:hypothetical protein
MAYIPYFPPPFSHRNFQNARIKIAPNKPATAVPGEAICVSRQGGNKDAKGEPALYRCVKR